MDDTSFEPINAGKGKEKAWQVDWTCLSVGDLERRQQTDAEAVAGILAVKVRSPVLFDHCLCGAFRARRPGWVVQHCHG